MEQLLIFITMLALGFFFGRAAESRHYRSIFKREQQFQRLIVMPDRMPSIEYARHSSELVSGNVVISVDYFKTVAAGLRSIFGGRVGAYETLLDRARREAILRMQQDAKRLGADAIYNLKFETSRISQNAGQALGSVEVLAYGTALIPSPQERAKRFEEMSQPLDHHGR